jgi:hypothetical protein
MKTDTQGFSDLSLESVDEDIQSILNVLISRARAALTYLQDCEAQALDEGHAVDRHYRSFWVRQMLDEMVGISSLIVSHINE